LGLLSPEDQQEYITIRSQFENAIAQSHRGERVDVFMQRLKVIRSSIEREPSPQWKQLIVCGVLFLSSTLAINIQQLRILLGKCKSSINVSLQQIGSVSKPSTNEIDQEIATFVPQLREDLPWDLCTVSTKISRKGN
jgi:hypothetical protein